MTTTEHTTSSRKNGPSADTVVIRPITVRRYTLFCRIVSPDIDEVTD